MATGKKCLECNGCCDIVYFLPKRFLYCSFCKIYYDIFDGKLTVVIPGEELKKHLDLIIKQQEDREKEKVHERFA